MKGHALLQVEIIGNTIVKKNINQTWNKATLDFLKDLKLEPVSNILFSSCSWATDLSKFFCLKLKYHNLLSSYHCRSSNDNML